MEKKKITKLIDFIANEYGGYGEIVTGNDTSGTIQMYTDDYIIRAQMDEHIVGEYILIPIRSKREDNEYHGSEDNKPIDWVDEYYTILYEYKPTNPTPQHGK